ncbi:cysteine hydrolase family protein [Sedimentibacter saalensis]|jgi:nicotinamidase-related amidase|uniref:Nicotinamidase-related amidase n=1 Tax=Sedimentibacter saalensis TaxID=130788 RepID=A0A562JEM9_9FIRM|nr:cysteine hydrolase family protein [Sedimentibacter saalensis]TWH81657.1 nicotinamidase-related amidase [Sedimentibacter saalensis]
MNNTILLVVDVQTALIEEHPYNEQNVIDNIKRLITVARYNEKEVIYVRHDDGKGEELEYGTDGWQIYYEIKPNNNEKVFEKQYNSAFLKTGLKEYLDSKKIDTIILTGLQTEYCIDTTCKAAFEHGYKLIIPEETNTTFDNEYLDGQKLYNFYNYKIWNNRFAKVLSLDETIKVLMCK